jgi:hypothetical protein
MVGSARGALREMIDAADELLAGTRMRIFLLHQLELAFRLHTALPDVPIETAYEHAGAACEAAEARDLQPELLLAVAYVESRFDPTAVSRVVVDRRQTGSYPSLNAPIGLNVRAGLFCGPLQTYAKSWAQCTSQRSLEEGYEAGARELTTWLADRYVRGSIARALAGHGCGYFGITSGRCNNYPARVLAIERRIRAPHRRAARRAGS